MLAGVSAAAVASASLLALVFVAWWDEAHQPAPKSRPMVERRVITTTKLVRPRPHVKVVKVVRPRGRG